MVEAPARQGRGEKPLLQPRMPWDDFLACGLREARGLIVHIQKDLPNSLKDARTNTEVAINDCLGG